MAESELTPSQVMALLEEEEDNLTPGEIMKLLGPDVAHKRYGGEIVSAPESEREPGSPLQLYLRFLAGQAPFQKATRAGIADSVIDTYLGLKELIGQKGELDPTIAEISNKEVERGGLPATVGRFGGEMAQMLAPGTAALRATKAASALPIVGSRLRQIASTPIGASVISGVGGAAPLAASRTPDEGDTRAENAAQEAALAAAGGYLGGKLISGIKKTPAAQAILNAGGYLTPGMAAKSKFVEGIEAIMEVTPFLAQGTKAARGKAAKQWNRIALNDARAPGMRKLKKTGSEGMALLKKGFERAYSKAWNKAIGQGDRIPVIEHLQNRINEFEGAAQAKLTRLAKDIEFADSPKRVDMAIRERLKASVNDPELQGLMQEARAIFRDTLGPGVRADLRRIDKKYPLYLTVQKAASNASAYYGNFTPMQLVAASRKIGGESAAATGVGPLLTQAQQGVETVGKSVGGQPLEWFRRVAGALATPAPMETMGRVALSQTRPQDIAKGFFQSSPSISSVGVGGTLPALFEE